MDDPPGEPPGAGCRSKAPPPEKERTEAELKMVYAAMMEELGIGRKDTLPLEDRGYSGPLPLSLAKPVTNPSQIRDDAIAAWYNVKFDDVDPAEGELDPMMDGQLFRIRREAMKASGNHAFSHHSRGNHSMRGGHASGIRGGAWGGRAQFSNGKNSRNPRGHDDMDNAQRIEKALKKLRAAVHQPSPPPGAPIGPSGRGHGSVAIGKGQAAVRAVRGGRTNAQVATHLPPPQLVTPEEFLAALGFPSQEKDTPAAGSVQPTSATTKTAKTILQNPNTKENAAPKPSQGKSKIEGALQKTKILGETILPSSSPAYSARTIQSNHKELDSLNLREMRGLAASRWAKASDTLSVSSTPAPAIRTANKPSTTADTAPSAPVNNSAGVAVNPSRLLKQYGAKVKKNSGESRPAIARLMQKPVAEKCLTLQICLPDGVAFLDEPVYDDAVLELKGSTVTYRAMDNDKSSLNWAIIFALPFEASSFYRTLVENRVSRQHEAPVLTPSVVSRPVQQPPKPTAVSGGQLQRMFATALTIRNSPVIKKHEVQISKRKDIKTQNEEVSGAVQQEQQLLPEPQPTLKVLPQKILSTEVASRSSTVQGSEPHNFAHLDSESRQSVFDIASAAATAETLDLVDAQSHSHSPEAYRPGSENRISTQSFSDMSEIAGVEPLLSFADDAGKANNDEPDSSLRSASDLAQDMIQLENDAFIVGTFKKLDDPAGSFLTRLSDAVVKANGPPMQELSSSEILRSSKYLIAAQKEVGVFLFSSDIFSSLPDLLSLGFIKAKSLKVLELALKAHTDLPESSATSKFNATVGTVTTTDELRMDEDAAGAPRVMQPSAPVDEGSQAQHVNAGNTLFASNISESSNAKETRKRVMTFIRSRTTSRAAVLKAAGQEVPLSSLEQQAVSDTKRSDDSITHTKTPASQTVKSAKSSIIYSPESILALRSKACGLHTDRLGEEVVGLFQPPFGSIRTVTYQEGRHTMPRGQLGHQRTPSRPAVRVSSMAQGSIPSTPGVNRHLVGGSTISNRPTNTPAILYTDFNLWSAVFSSTQEAKKKEESLSVAPRDADEKLTPTETTIQSAASVNPSNSANVDLAVAAPVPAVESFSSGTRPSSVSTVEVVALAKSPASQPGSLTPVPADKQVLTPSRVMSPNPSSRPSTPLATSMWNKITAEFDMGVPLKISSIKSKLFCSKSESVTSENAAGKVSPSETLGVKSATKTKSSQSSNPPESTSSKPAVVQKSSHSSVIPEPASKPDQTPSSFEIVVPISENATLSTVKEPHVIGKMALKGMLGLASSRFANETPVSAAASTKPTLFAPPAVTLSPLSAPGSGQILQPSLIHQLSTGDYNAPRAYLSQQGNQPQPIVKQAPYIYPIGPAFSVTSGSPLLPAKPPPPVPAVKTETVYFIDEFGIERAVTGIVKPQSHENKPFPQAPRVSPLKPDAPSFQFQSRRGSKSLTGSPTQREALNEVHQGDNIRAQIQARLDVSLAKGRGSSYSG